MPFAIKLLIFFESTRAFANETMKKKTPKKKLGKSRGTQFNTFRVSLQFISLQPKLQGCSNPENHDESLCISGVLLCVSRMGGDGWWNFTTFLAKEQWRNHPEAPKKLGLQSVIALFNELNVTSHVSWSISLPGISWNYFFQPRWNIVLIGSSVLCHREFWTPFLKNSKPFPCIWTQDAF